MVLRHFGVDTDPGRLNAWLSANGGYTRNGDILWDKPEDYPGAAVEFAADRMWDSWNISKDNDHWSDLKALLDEGYGVIVKVDGNRTTPALEGHWVVVTGFKGGSITEPLNYTVYDPWDDPSGLTYQTKTLGNFYDATYDNTFFAIRAYRPRWSDARPPAPQGVRAEAEGPGSVRLSWVPLPSGSEVVAYVIERLNRATGLWEKIGETPEPTAREFYDDQVQPLRTYIYRLKARSLSGQESEPSPEVSVTTPAASAQPRISRVEPAVPLSNGTPQPLVIHGENFQPGASVELWHEGQRYEIDPDRFEITSPTRISFKPGQGPRLGDQARTWSVKVINPGGEETTYSFETSVVPEALLNFVAHDPGFDLKNTLQQRWVAYMLATAKGESSFDPGAVESEASRAGQSYAEPDAVTGYAYYGRGYVQLTRADNYKKFSFDPATTSRSGTGLYDGEFIWSVNALRAEFRDYCREFFAALGTSVTEILQRHGNDTTVDLYWHPELALEPEISYAILSFGMRHGLFTLSLQGLDHFIKATAPQGQEVKEEVRRKEYVAARQIVNPGEKGDGPETVADYAIDLEPEVEKLPERTGQHANKVVNPSFEEGSLWGWARALHGTLETVSDDSGRWWASLTTSSPVSLYQVISTPAASFELGFDYQFLTTTGTLDVMLDSVVLASLDAPDQLPQGPETYTVTVSDPGLLGLDEATLEFRFDGPTGSQVLLSNIAVAAQEVPTEVLIGDGYPGSLVYTDADGTQVTVSLRRGSAAVLLDGDDVSLSPRGSRVEVSGQNLSLRQISLSDTTTRSSLSIRTRGGDRRATLGDIFASGPVGTIYAPAVDLEGDVLIEGTLRRLALGNVVGDQGTIVIGAAATTGDTARLSFGRVADLAVNSQTPIRSLVALEWLDAGADDDVITAPWIGTLRIKGNRRAGLAGQFDADLSLTGEGAPRGRALSSAVVAGPVTGEWTISGDVGTVRAGDATGWSLDVNSEVRSLTLGKVSGDTQVDVEGGIRSLRAVSWDGGSIEADWIGSLRVTGYRRDVPGDFSADLALDGNPDQRRRTLSSARIAGALTGDWTISGKVGSIRAGDATGWSLDVNSEVRSLTLGQVSGNTQVDVEGPIRSLRAISWDGGSIEADWIGSLRTTGARRPVEDNGDFSADITLSGNNAPRGRALSSASIVGSLTGGTWNIEAGNVGTVRALSFEPGWTLTAAVGEIRSLYSRGGFSSDVTAKSLTSLYVRQNLDGATITLTQPPEGRTYAARSITVRGWIDGCALVFSGNVRSVSAGGMRNSAIFAGVAGPGDGNGDGVLDLPDPATQLALGAGERCRIDSLRVTGIRGEEFNYINTNLAAAEFGNVYVRSSWDDNGQVPFGIAADAIARATWNGERFRGLEEPKDSLAVLNRVFRLI